VVVMKAGVRRTTKFPFNFDGWFAARVSIQQMRMSVPRTSVPTKESDSWLVLT
jgi:hypothetical protein